MIEKEILESGLVNKNANGTYIDRYREKFIFVFMFIF